MIDATTLLTALCSSTVLAGIWQYLTHRENKRTEARQLQASAAEKQILALETARDRISDETDAMIARIREELDEARSTISGLRAQREHLQSELHTLSEAARQEKDRVQRAYHDLWLQSQLMLRALQDANAKLAKTGEAPAHFELPLELAPNHVITPRIPPKNS